MLIANTDKTINYNYLLICLVCVVAVSIAHIIGNMAVISCVLLFYLCIVFFTKMPYLLQVMVFFVPWSAILKVTPNSISFCSIAMLLMLIKLIFNPIKFRMPILIMLVLLIMSTLIGKLMHSYFISLSYIMFFIMFFSFYVYIEKYSRYIMFENLIIFYSIGIISASFLSLILRNSPNITQFIKVIEYDYMDVTRLSGFYPDPNFYSAQIVTAIGGILVLINKSKIKLSFLMTLFLLLMTCGLLSVSKSFLLSIIILLFLWILCCLKEKNGRNKILFSLFVLTIIGSIVFLLKDHFSVFGEYQRRFVSGEGISSLTTGRSDLWMKYFRYIFDNPLVLLLGMGLSSTLEGVSKGSHNTLIQCFYQFGLIGTTILLSIIFYSMFNLLKGLKIELRYFFLMAFSCFFMWMGIDILLWDDFFLTISLFFIGLIYIGEPDREEKQRK